MTAPRDRTVHGIPLPVVSVQGVGRNPTRAIRFARTSVGWAVVTAVPPPWWMLRLALAIGDLRSSWRRTRCRAIMLSRRGSR